MLRLWGVRNPMRTLKKIDKRKTKSVSPKARNVAKILAENHGMAMGEAMIRAGYSPITALKPSNLTNSKGWQELMDEYLPEENVAQVHRALLNSHNIDHMVFPLGPKDETEIEQFIAREKEKTEKAGKVYVEVDYLSDEHIREMLKDVNCTVRRIVHGEQARHVYFFAPDNRARKDALDMVYKLRGSYAAEKHDVRHFSLLGLGKRRDEEMLNGNADLTVLDTSPPALDAP